MVTLSCAGFQFQWLKHVMCCKKIVLRVACAKQGWFRHFITENLLNIWAIPCVIYTPTFFFEKICFVYKTSLFCYLIKINNQALFYFTLFLPISDKVSYVPKEWSCPLYEETVRMLNSASSKRSILLLRYIMFYYYS